MDHKVADAYHRLLEEEYQLHKAQKANNADAVAYREERLSGAYKEMGQVMIAKRQATK